MGSSNEEIEIEKEVKHFNFRHMCKLCIGQPVEDVNNCYNHLAVSNGHGLIFVVSSTAIKVVSLGTLEKISVGNINVNDAVAEYPHELIPVGLNIERICLNCDETNLIVIHKDAKGVHIGAINVCILNAQDRSNPVYTSTTLHNSTDVFVVDVRCHPELASIIAICLSNGHVFMIDLTLNDGFKVFASLTQGSSASSLCWSPKGKQIVIGFVDGKLIQYDKLLKNQKKVTNGPDIFHEGQKQVGGLFWISSYLFMAVYNTPNLSESPIFVMVSTQKDGPPSYSVMDDIYFGFNEERLLCYYFSYLAPWQLMITMASNAMEAVPVGVLENKWYRWGLSDNGRAEVPLSVVDNNDAFAVGTGICLNSSLPIKQDDKDLPPAPVFAMLTTDGVLCTYQMVNQSSTAIATIQQGMLTAPIPIPNVPPKKGQSSFCATQFPSGAAPASVIQPTPVAKPTTFNFGTGTATSSPSIPAANVGMRFETPLPSTTPVFSLSNPQVSTQNVQSFAFSSNTAMSSSSSSVPAVPSKPLFNLGSPAQSTGFSFSPASSADCTLVKPLVSVVDNSLPAKPEASFFTPVVRPSDTPSAGPAKPLFQPVAQQQPAPVKPQVLPLMSDKISIFSPVIGTANSANQQHSQQQRPPLSSTTLITPQKPIPQQQAPVLPNEEKSPGFAKTEKLPGDAEIAKHTEKWNTTLQKNIVEEINNFTAELHALKESCADLNCDVLIGSRSELIEMKSSIAELVGRMDGYKDVMQENKSEGTLLRENVMKNLKMLDEARLLKEKMEDKRYSNAMKSRPLDPISSRQRKAVRAHVNQVEQLLNDINAALDSKWEERMAHRKNSRNNKTSAIAKRQQLYQTVDAIDQITNNLSTRLNKLSVQSQEISLLSMNTTRKSSFNDTNTTQMKASPHANSTTKATNSPLKLKQLKTYLNNRGQTPVRKAKHYTSLIVPRDNDDQTLNPSFSNFPKAASTPAVSAQSVKSPLKVPSSLGHPAIDENMSLSNTLTKIDKEYMTPTVLSKAPVTLTNLRVPDNTPVTPDVISERSQSSKVSDSELVNKNLFGTPLAPNSSLKQSTQVFSKVKPAFNILPSSPAASKISESETTTLPNPFSTSAVDPKSFWCNSDSTTSQKDDLNAKQPGNVFSGDIPTGDSPEGNHPELNIPSSSPNTTVVVTEIDPSFTQEASDKSTANALEEEKIVSAGSSSTSGFSFTFSASKTSQQTVPSVPSTIKVTPAVTPSETESKFSLPEKSTVSFSFGTASNTSSTSANTGFFHTKTPPTTGLFGSSVFASSPALPPQPASGLFGSNMVQPALPTAATTSNSSSVSEQVTTSVFGVNVPKSGLFSAVVPTATDLPTSVSLPTNSTTTTSSSTTSIVASTAEALFAVTTSGTTQNLFEAVTTTATSDGQNVSTAGATQSAGLFGTTTSTLTSGPFGANASVSTGTHGSSTVSAGGFFAAAAATTSAATSPSGLFATATSTSAGVFDAATTTTSTVMFEAASSTPSTGLFGTAATTSSTGLFSTATTPSTGLFAAATTSSTGLFAAATTPSTGLFAAATTSSTGLFGTATTPSTGLFGTATTPSTGLFATATTPSTGLFAASTTPSTGLFAASTTPSTGLFAASTTPSTGLFAAASTTSTGLFAAASTTSTGLFGAAATTTSGGLFGSATTTTSGGLFGASTSSAPTGLFGASTTSAPGNLFGAVTTSATSPNSGFFKPQSSSAGGIFGGSGGGLFGKPDTSIFGGAPTTTNIFLGSTTTTSTPAAFGSSAFGAASSQPKEGGGGGFGGFGLGGGPVNDPNKNPFGSIPSAPGNTSTNLFGASTSSPFGQTSTTSQIGSGTFSKGFGSGIGSGMATPAAAPVPAFGSAPAFGSPPAFGGSPAFGGAPTFGSSPQGTFGGGATFGAGSTFGSGAVFGGGSALPSFGSLASQSDSTPTFGSQAAQAAPAFGFGNGSSSTPTQSGQQFSSWR